MTDARQHIDANTWNDALDRQEEAHRLLEEILEKLRQPQPDEQDQQDQQQPQPQPQQLSKEELQRLVEAVMERNQRQQKRAKRTPVKEDW